MLERNCMAKLKINLQNPVWLSLGALFCCVLWGSAFPCVKIAYPLFKISDTGSQILFAGVRFFYIGNNYFYCRVHFGKTDFAGEEAVDSGDYQAGVIADYDSIYVFSH